MKAKKEHKNQENNHIKKTINLLKKLIKLKNINNAH